MTGVQTCALPICNLTTLKQGQNYLFMNSGNTAYDQKVSGEIFKMNTNTPVKVTMTIWIEGADKDCINEIAGDVLKSRIQFICTDLD